MAQSFLTVLRKPLGCGYLSRMKNIGLSAVYSQDVKHVYSRSALGIDGFEHHKEKVKMQMANIADKFKEKMSEYVHSETKNMIFTEDLKNMIHLADSDKEAELTVQMLKRYNKQNKSMRFGSYIFGPVIMRMLYSRNMTDLAVECFKSEDLVGIFDQQISYQLLLNLLYENQRYQEMLDIFQIITERQLEGRKYPRHVVVLAMAACYKLNNQESLDYALKLWSDLTDTGHQAMRKAATFCAGLALNQGKPEIALEILASVRNQSYTTVRNLKVAALAEIGRIEDVIPILKIIVSADQPQVYGNIHTFNKDVIEKVKKAMAKSDNAELTLEFNRLEQIFQKEGHISEKSLDDQLCVEIQRPPAGNTDFRQQQTGFHSRGQYNNNRGFQQKPRTGSYNIQRPGLVDLV